MRCSSSNHPPKENIQLGRKNKAIGNSIASLDDSGDSENDKKQVPDSTEHIVAHFIHINTDAGGSESDKSSPEKNKG